jgi:hypothetical protein
MDDEMKMPNTLSPVAPKKKTHHDMFMPKIHSRTRFHVGWVGVEGQCTASEVSLIARHFSMAGSSDTTPPLLSLHATHCYPPHATPIS